MTSQALQSSFSPATYMPDTGLSRVLGMKTSHAALTALVFAASVAAVTAIPTHQSSQTLCGRWDSTSTILDLSAGNKEQHTFPGLTEDKHEVTVRFTARKMDSALIDAVGEIALRCGVKIDRPEGFPVARGPGRPAAPHIKRRAEIPHSAKV